MTDQTLSLAQLAEQIKDQIAFAFADSLWVHAEISELHENASGHAYFELIEKDRDTDRIVAKSKATCWANFYRMLKPYFESSTGEMLRRGLKVLLQCRVEYHELYGISLNIRDIEPSFTLGDMARQRQEILRRLQADGVIDMNRELPLARAPQRIAVISSATAAGYGDFTHQLLNNAGGFAFYVKLFPAAMQGEQTAASIIAALDEIFANAHFFDAVAIIRGGGATAELSSFDNYELALNCAQFPLPIITGIGHERDESVLDLVAHTRCKTPTAAAEFLIQQMDDALDEIAALQDEIASFADEILLHEKNHLKTLQMRFPNAVNGIIFKEKSHLAQKENRLKQSSQKAVYQQQNRLALLEKTLQLSSPETLLKRGFALVSLNGKIVKAAAELRAGDRITTHFHDGKTSSIVES